MKIAVIGAGYVGLVTGACFAEYGSTIQIIDVNNRKIQCLKKGEIPFYEPGLSEIVNRGLESGRLHFTDSLIEGVAGADFVFIAVGTPQAADGSADCSAVFEVAEKLSNINEHFITVIKSTVPVGTAEKVREYLPIVISNPEFLAEGSAVADCLKPDRVVIGGKNEGAIKQLKALYKPFMRNHNKLLIMSNESAELVKYASNGMLATKISYINEISRLCDALGADVMDVRLGMGADSRIGYDFTYPGIGYGGSCFPKDVAALIYQAEREGLVAQVLAATERVNYAMQNAFLSEVYMKTYTGAPLAAWGLSFKPGTDDTRAAPGIAIINKLVSNSYRYTVNVHDPRAVYECPPGVTRYEDKYKACEGTEALLLFTEWPEYRAPDFERLVGMGIKAVFDGRNLYDPETVRAAGLAYFGIGRGGV